MRAARRRYRATAKKRLSHREGERRRRARKALEEGNQVLGILFGRLGTGGGVRAYTEAAGRESMEAAQEKLNGLENKRDTLINELIQKIHAAKPWALSVSFPAAG